MEAHDTYIFKITVSDESIVEMLWSECLCPPNSHVETLSPSAVVFESGKLGGDEVIRMEPF